MGSRASEFGRSYGDCSCLSEVDAWWEVWSANGRLSWEQLLEPAIQYAEKGVPVSRDLERWIHKDKALLLEQASLARTFMPNGVPLQQGEKLLQP